MERVLQGSNLNVKAKRWWRMARSATSQFAFFASLPMAVGIGVMASRLGWIFIVAANWLFLYRLVFRRVNRGAKAAPTLG